MQNPDRADVLADPLAWPWSSAAAHAGRSDPSGLLDLSDWPSQLDDLDWSSHLRRSLPEPDLHRIRRATTRGRPLASDSFLAKLEKRLGRRLRPLPVGRPRKAAKKRAKVARPAGKER